MRERLHENQIDFAEEVLAEEVPAGKKKKSPFRSALMSTVMMLMVAAAAAVLVANLLMPVLQIYGTSMNPTLTDGEVVVALKGGKLERGDVIAFYYNNKILVKRVIGTAGDKVNITADGTVYVNDELQIEPYISEKSDGDPDINLPYQVPEGKYFVIGDNRPASADSRHSTIGCVAEDDIVGRLVLRVWPLSQFGTVS